jgi:hypothetical protein
LQELLSGSWRYTRIKETKKEEGRYQAHWALRPTIMATIEARTRGRNGHNADLQYFPYLYNAKKPMSIRLFKWVIIKRLNRAPTS